MVEFCLSEIIYIGFYVMFVVGIYDFVGFLEKFSFFGLFGVFWGYIYGILGYLM